MNDPLPQTDISDWPELAVIKATQAIESYEPVGDLCKNPDCPSPGGVILMQAFMGTGYCSVNCKKACGIDHVAYEESEMMLVTREEQSRIHAERLQSDA